MNNPNIITTTNISKRLKSFQNNYLNTNKRPYCLLLRVRSIETSDNVYCYHEYRPPTSASRPRGYSLPWHSGPLKCCAPHNERRLCTRTGHRPPCGCPEWNWEGLKRPGPGHRVHTPSRAAHRTSGLSSPFGCPVRP